MIALSRPSLLVLLAAMLLAAAPASANRKQTAGRSGWFKRGAQRLLDKKIGKVNRLVKRAGFDPIDSPTLFGGASGPTYVTFPAAAGPRAAAASADAPSPLGRVGDGRWAAPSGTPASATRPAPKATAVAEIKLAPSPFSDFPSDLYAAYQTLDLPATASAQDVQDRHDERVAFLRPKAEKGNHKAAKVLTQVERAHARVARHLSGPGLSAEPFAGFPATVVDAYRLLNISADATPDEIKAAGRAKLMTVHPDHGNSPNASADIRAVREAMEVAKAYASTTR